MSAIHLLPIKNCVYRSVIQRIFLNHSTILSKTKNSYRKTAKIGKINFMGFKLKYKKRKRSILKRKRLISSVIFQSRLDTRGVNKFS